VKRLPSSASAVFKSMRKYDKLAPWIVDQIQRQEKQWAAYEDEYNARAERMSYPVRDFLRDALIEGIHIRVVDGELVWNRGNRKADEYIVYNSIEILEELNATHSRE